MINFRFQGVGLLEISIKTYVIYYITYLKTSYLSFSFPLKKKVSLWFKYFFFLGAPFYGVSYKITIVSLSASVFLRQFSNCLRNVLLVFSDFLHDGK